MMGFGMFGGMFFFWVVLIVLAVLSARGLFPANPPGGAQPPLTARQILEQRYARGEITQEQFRLMLKDLQE